MKSLKLSKDVKDLIAYNLVYYKHKQRVLDEAKEYNKLTDAVYAEILPQATLDTIATLPEGLFKKDCGTYLIIMGMYKNVDFSYYSATRYILPDVFGRAKFDELRKELEVVSPVTRRVVYSSTDKLRFDCYSKVAELVDSIDSLISDLKQDVLEDFNTVKNALYAVNSTKQLNEVWPEAMDFLPEDMKQGKCTALAVPVTDLNNRFNLPI